MNIPHLLVNSLNKEEVRNYKLWSSKIGAKTKLETQYFDVLRDLKKGTKTELAFQKEHYPTNNNAFYRLRNRLINNIGKSLVELHVEEDVLIKVSHWLQLGRLFLLREKYALAHYYLKKAKKYAEKEELYDYLSIIYAELIKLSYEIDNIELEALIDLQENNLENQVKLLELNGVLALVNKQLKISQNTGLSNEKLLSELNQIVTKYGADEQLKSSFRFRHAIYLAISQNLLSQKNYDVLQTFTAQTYKDFETFNLWNRERHESKIQMLTFLINAAYENKKHDVSLEYAEKLYDTLLEHNKLHFNKYLFFYYQSLVLNLTTHNKPKAIRILEELSEDKEIVSQSYYHQFIHLNLALLYYDLLDHKHALVHINTLRNNSHFSTTANQLKLEILLFEICLSYSCLNFENVINLCKELSSERLIKLDKYYKMINIFCLNLISLCRAKNASQEQKEKESILEFNSHYHSNLEALNQIFNITDWINNSFK